MPGKLLRIKDIIGCSKLGIVPIIPVCKSTWWAGVNSGKFPKSVKISKGITCWRSEDIEKYLESLG